MGVRTDPSAALAMVLAMEPGCSWIFVQKPLQEPISPTPPLVCTSSAASPVMDAVASAPNPGPSCSGGFCFDVDLKDAQLSCVSGVEAACKALEDRTESRQP